MNTKAAKDYLVQETTEQAALEHVPLADLEKRMMYFAESDPASCANPIELNEKFEQEYDTPEYEAKISRLLHHAYKRLKEEDPERARQWDQAVRVLRRGDHYFLVSWDIEPPSDHPVRDFFKPFGIGLLIAVGIAIATFFSVTYNIEFDRYRKYFPILLVILVLSVSRAFPLIYRLLLMWLRRETKEDERSN
jgi:hypothetical protein